MNNQDARKGLRTWIEIDKKNLKNNYNIFRSIIPKNCLLMSVVKSNAYGHGLVDFSNEISKLGVDWLGVDSAVEALALREEGIEKPILILGYTLPEMLPKVFDEGISVSISSFEALEAIKNTKTSKSKKIHIKVDTGMGRQGFLKNDLPKVLKELEAASDVQVEGLFTHFAAAKNPSFPSYTKNQIENFQEWIKSFKDAGFKPIVHAAASSGTLIFPESHFDMVRVGISLYGYWPSPEVEAFCKDKYKLESVLSWKTIISEVKTLKKDSKIGYDITEELDKDTKVAVCPIGYWHGFSRSLSSIARVLVNGKRCRVLGRVSMDMISIDVSDADAKVGDEVVILGGQGNENVSADELAHLSDTTNYEIITRINPLIKRIYLN